MERIIPYIMQNKSRVWNHQPASHDGVQEKNAMFKHFKQTHQPIGQICDFRTAGTVASPKRQVAVMS